MDLLGGQVGGTFYVAIRASGRALCGLGELRELTSAGVTPIRYNEHVASRNLSLRAGSNPYGMIRMSRREIPSASWASVIETVTRWPRTNPLPGNLSKCFASTMPLL